MDKHIILENGNVENVGLPPGSLVYHGGFGSVKAVIELIDYGKSFMDHKRITSSELKALEPPLQKRWLKIIGLQNSALMRIVGEKFNIDNLVLEDIMNTTQRPKLEIIPDGLFLTMKALYYEDQNELKSEQISFVMKKNLLLSFHEQDLDIFRPLEKRFQLANQQIMQSEIDYLFYMLMDIVVDNYYLITETISDRLSDLENKIFGQEENDILPDIQLIHKDLLVSKKAITGVRDAVSMLLKENEGFIPKRDVKFFKDVYDHILQITESLESYRDLNSNLRDLYLSNMSNKMNNVMKTLTIISTIFIPITFLVGIYGMNFVNMPELHFRYGYYILWGVCVTVAVIMLMMFRRKKWL
jgi:magnesium Mg(2+) and cobalt Co(2+) transport protein (corA)